MTALGFIVLHIFVIYLGMRLWSMHDGDIKWDKVYIETNRDYNIAMEAFNKGFAEGIDYKAKSVAMSQNCKEEYGKFKPRPKSEDKLHAVTNDPEETTRY